MYGGTIGSLNLYQVVGRTETLIWTQSGNKGRQWLSGQVPVGNVAGYKVITVNTFDCGAINVFHKANFKKAPGDITLLRFLFSLFLLNDSAGLTLAYTETKENSKNRAKDNIEPQNLHV